MILVFLILRRVGLCRKIAFSRQNPEILYWKINDLRVQTFLFSVICDRARYLALRVVDGQAQSQGRFPSCERASGLEPASCEAVAAYLLGEQRMGDVPGVIVLVLVVIAFLVGFLLRGFLDD